MVENLEKIQKNTTNYSRNLISVSGKILSLVSFLVVACLFVLDLIVKEQNPYLGIFAYLVIPGFLVLGLLLIPVGAYIERSRKRKKDHIPHFPVFDFNNPRHQKLAYITWGIITVFLLFSIIGIYQAYHFTESNTFCGQICHKVMSPEFTAYHESAHARVECTTCHIGSGAKWYVRSKISGLYQVYSVLTNSYPRPIETPIHNLRPAQETCEHCHWPQKFFGSIEQNHSYFLSDEANTEWKTRMLIFVGGGNAAEGVKDNVHSHVVGDRKISYIATDAKRQVIPWVKVIESDGKEKIFVDKESGFSADKLPQGEMRTMDCIDCHNRPSHVYKAPAEAINEAMDHGDVDPSLPYIKQNAVKSLTGSYQSQEEAAKKIRESLEQFYEQKYPEVWSSKKDILEKAILAIVRVYQTNFFPEMGVSWKIYPENIGHLISPGCFRCHNGKHETQDGKKIPEKCSQCHAIIAQGTPQNMETKVEGLEFKHPDQNVGEAWKVMPCTSCHTGE